MVPASPAVPPGHRLLNPSLGLEHHICSMHGPWIRFGGMVVREIRPSQDRVNEAGDVDGDIKEVSLLWIKSPAGRQVGGSGMLTYAAI